MSRLFSTRVLPAGSAACSIVPATRLGIGNGAADGELVQIQDCPAQEQEQWKPCPGEDQAYRRDEDRSDVGRMEK